MYLNLLGQNIKEYRTRLTVTLDVFKWNIR